MYSKTGADFVANKVGSTGVTINPIDEKYSAIVSARYNALVVLSFRESKNQS